VDIGAPITVLAAIPVGGSGARRVIYGASQNLLGTIDADGTKVKEIGVPQYRGIASEPQNITVADLDGDGVPSIVVGARSWQYLAYTPDLELEWKNVIYAHSATVAEVADLDGDGNMETVGGNAYYCMNIINSDGSRRLRAGRFGPEQSAVTSADLTGNGKREVVLGTDGGDVLVFDLEGNQLWERNVGDRVTSLCPVSVGGTDAVLAASESGFVWALDGAGKALWSVNLGEPVRRMIAIPGGVACAVSGAGIVTLTESGRVATVSATPAAAMDISVRNGFCGAMLRDGTLCAAPVAIRE
jgi:WD40 repeat protein